MSDADASVCTYSLQIIKERVDVRSLITHENIKLAVFGNACCLRVDFELLVITYLFCATAI